MSIRVSESIVLRTYPLREADVIVSFLSRDAGKLRGVARRARKPGNPFGAGIERLSHVRLHYNYRENRELQSLESCDLIHARFALGGDYELTVALDYIAEVSEQLLPPLEPNEKYFRLLMAVLAYLRDSGRGGLWAAVNYFTLWSVRLTGILGPMELGDEDLALAEEMLRTPVAALGERDWTRQAAAGLRRQLVDQIEDHIERRLVTVRTLESID